MNKYKINVKENNAGVPLFLQKYLRGEVIGYGIALLLCISGVIFVSLVVGSLRLSMKPVVAILAYTTLSFLTIFFARRVFISGVFFVFPEKSRTIKVMESYGDPRQIMIDCSNSISTPEEPYKKGDYAITENYIALFYPTYVYIAPSSELMWAFTARNVRVGRYSFFYWSLEFCFSSGDIKSLKIAEKATCIAELEHIKKLNPNVLVGYNKKADSLIGRRGFEAFKQELLSDIEIFQAETDIREQMEFYR